jgi:hypothetical protein
MVRASVTPIVNLANRFQKKVFADEILGGVISALMAASMHHFVCVSIPGRILGRNDFITRLIDLIRTDDNSKGSTNVTKKWVTYRKAAPTGIHGINAIASCAVPFLCILLGRAEGKRGVRAMQTKKRRGALLDVQ